MDYNSTMTEHEHPIGLSRRRFLTVGASIVIASCTGDDDGSDATTAAPAAPTPTTDARPIATTAPTATTDVATTPATTVDASVALAADPFLAGVASGDPDATSVVLWTRLLGDDLPDEVPVTWQLLDGTEVVASGTERAVAAHGHAVHAVADLDRPLSYRFVAGGFTSRDRSHRTDA